MSQFLNWIETNALVISLTLAALVILLIVLFILVNTRRTAKWRSKEFESNKEAELLKARIADLEKETQELHEQEKRLVAERDDILTTAHEQADDILEQTMERVQQSEARIRQNRIIASCCITDARRRIADLMIEVSKRLVIDDGTLQDPQEISPEAVEDAEAKESLAETEFVRAIDRAASPTAEDDSLPLDPETAGMEKPIGGEETASGGDVQPETPQEQPEETAAARTDIPEDQSGDSPDVVTDVPDGQDQSETDRSREREL